LNINPDIHKVQPVMLLKLVNLAAFILMILMNYLANALPLNGKTTGQLSDQYPNLFTPAGITFSIWGVIYLLLIGFSVIQFSSQNKSVLHSIGWAFAISCLLNALWIVAWHYEQLPLSLLIMLGLLVTLIFINARIQTSPVFFKISFGIYLGWICIATIANVTALLVSMNWGGLGISEAVWAIIVILAGTAIAILAITKFDNPYIGLAVIWALAGIMIKRQADVMSIVIVAGIGIALVAITAVWLFLQPTANSQ
jgi:hypothetical protein